VGDFFAFRRMIAPLLIHILFWVGVIVTIGLGVLMLIDKMDPVWDNVSWTTQKFPNTNTSAKDIWGETNSTTKMIVGIIVLIGGPFFFRIYCELLMLPFRINDTLTDIRNLQKPQPQATVGMAPRR
jgi:hypothetical protein